MQSTSARGVLTTPPSPMSKAGMSSPRPTASLAMTPGIDTLFPRAVFGLSSANHHYAAAYTAKVRIAVRAGALTITREGCGSGNAKAPTPGEAHELALKAAETDATKRALATFGNPFGLALYDRELAGVKNRKALVSAPDEYRGPWLLSLPNGAGQSFNKADEFVVALRKALTEAPDIEQLFAIWERNVDAVRAINKTDQSLNATRRYRSKSRCASEEPRNRIGQTRRRSIRAIARTSGLTRARRWTRVCSPSPEPKRIRSKEHLRFVASQPCVICGRTPSHAHHVRYAQPRGLSS